VLNPIGWLNAGIVWGYAFVWFLILNGVKMIVCRIQGKAGGTSKEAR
jgi:hypothetical protein